MNWVVGLVFLSLLGSYIYYDWQDSYRVVDRRYISGTCKENHTRISDEYQGEVIKLHNAWKNTYRYEGHLQKLYFFKDFRGDRKKIFEYETPIAFELILDNDYKLGGYISDVDALSNGGWYWGGDDEYRMQESRCFLDYIKQSEIKKISLFKND